MKSKYYYLVQCRNDRGEWVEIARDTLSFCLGYFFARKECNIAGLNQAWRVIREDGKLIDECVERNELALGMIVGFPTIQQYISASIKALEKTLFLVRNDNEKKDKITKIIKDLKDV